MKLHHIAVAALVVTIAGPARADLLARKDLSLGTAVTIATTAIEQCKTNGYQVSATVVGRSGEVILQMRGDNTGPHTMENSFRKAYTSRTFRVPSGEIAERLKANPQLPLIHLSNVVAAADRAQDELRDAAGDVGGDALDDRVGVADREIAGRVAAGAPLVGLQAARQRRIGRRAEIEWEAGAVMVIVDRAAGLGDRG